MEQSGASLFAGVNLHLIYISNFIFSPLTLIYSQIVERVRIFITLYNKFEVGSVVVEVCSVPRMRAVVIGGREGRGGEDSKHISSLYMSHHHCLAVSN